MINYCLDYTYQHNDYVEWDTYTLSSEEERNETIKVLEQDERYTITNIYENEDCYCHARYEGECACGNFK